MAKKYAVQLTDPPWPYSWQRDKAHGGYKEDYRPMKVPELKALRERYDGFAADDCVMFCWATLPKIKLALAMLDYWGFRYATTAFVWVKTSTKRPGVPEHRCIGYWTACNVELCLLARRGRVKAACRKVHQIIMAPRRETGRKPDAIYGRIERLMGDVPRIECFARQRVPGWDAWGRQKDKFRYEGKTP